MTQARILPFVGPAFVLYLVAHAASRVPGIDQAGWMVAAIAALTSLAPLVFERRLFDRPGGPRVAVLCAATGLGLVTWVTPSPSSPVVGVAAAVGHAVTGALLLDLAITVPTVLRGPGGSRLRFGGSAGRLALAVVAAAVATLGGIATLGAIQWSAEGVVKGSALAQVPLWFAVGSAVGAVGLRAARRWWGDRPEAIAANAWALGGLSVAIGFVLWALLCVLTGAWEARAPWGRGWAAGAGWMACLGHAAMLDPRLRLSAGPTLRRATAGALALASIMAAVWSFQWILPSDPPALAITVALAAAALVVLTRLYRNVLGRRLAPFRGRLLDAITDIEADLSSVTRLDEIARVTLGPFRRASGDLQAEPLLWTVDPVQLWTVDAAGQARARPGTLPEAIVQGLLERPGEIVARQALEGLTVRRPHLRPLAEALERCEAEAAIPLMVSGDLEGVVLLPRGARRRALTIEELQALRNLSSRLANLVGVTSAQARAQARAGERDTETKALADHVEHLEGELGLLRAESRLLKASAAVAGRQDTLVAYSPAMRAVAARIDRLARVEGPVLVEHREGCFVEPIVQRLHDAGGGHAGPLFVGECGRITPEEAPVALFGSTAQPARPGWLELARGGTLWLKDVAALPREVQGDLAEALASHDARPVGGTGSYPVEVRLVATSRLPAAAMTAAPEAHPDLWEWLAGLSVEVPALRDRTEDLPSLVLLALDRASRILGRPPVGIHPQALHAITAYSWPGDEAELNWVIQTAVHQTEGSQVRVADLPLAWSGRPQSTEGHPFDGTYAELEGRLLQHALQRAGGNKSEAARALGLKRTTFLDKLRRLGTEPRPAPKPAAVRPARRAS